MTYYSQDNGKLRLAMVGLNFGKELIDRDLSGGAASHYFDLAAVCGLERDKTDAVAAERGVRAYYSLDDVLADRDIEAVCLIVGPKDRAAKIRKIIDAGKHVMTTKPFETDAQAGLEVLQYAKKHQCVVHLNSPSPLPSPDLGQIFEWQKNKGLGRPIAARADMWASSREKADGSWYDDPEGCPVAPIFRIGIYAINDLIRLLGEPESVSVMVSRIFTGRPTPDNAQLAIRFASGVLANVFASFCVRDGHYWRNSLTLNYENGTVYRNVGPAKSPDPFREPELSVVTFDGKKSQVETAVANSASDIYQWKNFSDAIRGKPLDGELTPEEVVRGLRVIEAMRRAEKSNREEKV